MTTNTLQNSPFHLDNHQVYKQWREKKLQAYPLNIKDIMVKVDNPGKLSAGERQKMLDSCGIANFCLYRVNRNFGDLSKQDLINLGLQLGLKRMDHNLCADTAGVSSITVTDQGRANEYIPYTNRPINWHTDGYYNNKEQRIKSMVLHCIHAAGTGGENALLDPEIAYILMRDHDPEMVFALMQEDALTIPANMENGKLVRAAQSGPVFTLHGPANFLHMRYTARTRSIHWKSDSNTRRAVAFLQDLLTSDLEYKFNYRLQAGEGLLSNNILHNRSGFENLSDGGSRLLYRVRYYDHIHDENLIN